MGNAPSSDGSSTVDITPNPQPIAQLITQSTTLTPTFTQPTFTQPITQPITPPITPPSTSTTVDDVKTEKNDNFFISFLEDNELIIPLAVVGVATIGMTVYSLSKK